MPPATREWLPPQNSAPKGAFLLLHGIESHAGWFAPLAPLLAEQGYAVLAPDRPGSGAAAGPRGHLASYRTLLEDVSKLATRAEREWGAVHLAGMSWGGMAALYIALRRPWLFASLTMLAPGLVARRGIGPLGKARSAAAFLAGKERTTPLAIAFTPADFTNDPNWRNFIAADPNRNAAVTTGFAIETAKMLRFIKETAGSRRPPPALCLLAENDVIVNNPATAKLARRAGAAVEVVPAAAHTLIFENPQAIASRMERHAGEAAEAAVKPAGNVWFLGGGAVGGALAALLTRGGGRAAVLVKDKYLEQYRAGGITLTSGKAEATARGIVFASAPEELARRAPEPELVVVAVKSFDTAEVLQSVGPYIPGRAVVASIQNGVTGEEAIRCALPNNTIVAGSVLAGLEMLAPGRISYPDDRGGLAAATHHGDDVLAKAIWLKHMRRTGMAARWLSGANAAARLKWSKLILNLGTNAINSATGLSAAEIFAHPEYGPMAISAMREGLCVMKKLSLPPANLPGYPVAGLARLVRVCPVGILRNLLSWKAGGGPEAAFSMRQDIMKGRGGTEIAELNGKIMEVASTFGLKAEANIKLVRLAQGGGAGVRHTS